MRLSLRHCKGKLALLFSIGQSASTSDQGATGTSFPIAAVASRGRDADSLLHVMELTVELDKQWLGDVPRQSRAFALASEGFAD